MKHHNFPALVAMLIGYLAIAAIASIVFALGAALRYFGAQQGAAQPDKSTQVDATSLAPIFVPVGIPSASQYKRRSTAGIIANEWREKESNPHDPAYETGGRPLANPAK